MDFTPGGRQKDKQVHRTEGERKMGKAEKKRRVYTTEFKAEAAALAEKREKPVIQVARDLGISDTVLHRWL
jgi:transposase-like protein